MTVEQLWNALTPTHREALVNYAAYSDTPYLRSQVIDDLLSDGLVTVIETNGSGDVWLGLTPRGDALVTWAEMLRKHR